jgi:hypothetical protein
MRSPMRSIGIVVLLFSAVFIQPSSGNPRNAAQNPSAMDDKSKVVYVCACLKTKSCSCMTEAKRPGPCACGTEGSPPLKAVPRDSAWAKENRKELAK